MQPLAELTLQESQEHGGRYDGRKIPWENGSVQQAEPAGCTHMGLGAEPAEAIPHHLRQAARPSKVQVIWEFVVMHRSEAVLSSTRGSMANWQGCDFPKKFACRLRFGSGMVKGRQRHSPAGDLSCNIAGKGLRN